MNDETTLTNRRNHLQNQIDEFQEQALKLLPDGLEAGENYMADGDWNYGGDVDEDGWESGETTQDRPELLPINLPSMLISADALPDFEVVRAKELEIRIGQANDALYNLRAAIANRSFLYRTNMRTANTYAKKTRARTAVDSVSETVSKRAREYGLIRRALEALGAPPETLRKYQVLTREDLKADTKVLEENARGTRNTKLSWIWSVEGPASVTTEMLEGRQCHSYRRLIIDRRSHCSC